MENEKESNKIERKVIIEDIVPWYDVFSEKTKHSVFMSCGNEEWKWITTSSKIPQLNEEYLMSGKYKGIIQPTDADKSAYLITNCTFKKVK